jgi:hypothetical protein
MLGMANFHPHPFFPFKRERRMGEEGGDEINKNIYKNALPEMSYSFVIILLPHDNLPFVSI